MNIGLLAGNRLSDFRLQTLRPILEDESFSIKLAIIDNRPKKSIKQKIIRNFRRGRGGYILVMAFNWYFGKKDNGISVKAFCREQGIALIETQNLYEPETLALIKKYQLDVLLLMGGFGIIKDALINITPKGILSYHHGDMRKYRGMPPGLWELYNNETNMGITVQRLTAGLDCGLPIVEKTVSILPTDPP